MSERRRGLGRGLGALIPSAPAAETAEREEPGAGTPPTPPAGSETAPPVGGTTRVSRETPATTTAPTPEDVSPADAGTADKDPRSGESPRRASGGRADSSTRKPASEEPRQSSGDEAPEPAEPTGGPKRPAAGGRGRTVSPAARQKAMKARMDMGEALRNTTLVSRPSDMFFLPSGATPEGDGAASAPAGPTPEPAAATETTATEAPSETAATDASADVSRGTAASADQAAGRQGPARRSRAGKSGTERSTSEIPAELETDSSSRAPEGPAENAPGNEGAEAPEPATPASGGAADPADPTNSPASTASADNGPATSGRTRTEDVSRETDAGAEELAAVPGATFAEIPVASIHPNRKQPRQVFDEEELAELAYSIGELGVLQPIVVRSSREGGEQSYELVMGERRWRATQRAGLATIPAIVRETADDELLRDALLENLHRSQLNPLEEAAAYQQLLEEFGTTQEELSRRIGRSRPQISNTIRLLRLPPLVQRRVAAGVLSSGHARALLSLAEPAEMERLAQRIVAEGLSVRATEEAVQLAGTGERKPQRTPAPAGRHKERLDYIADAFSDRLDTSVRIALGARKGKMTIEFASVEDLNRIIEVLDPGIERN